MDWYGEEEGKKQKTCQGHRRNHSGALYGRLSIHDILSTVYDGAMQMKRSWYKYVEVAGYKLRACSVKKPCGNIAMQYYTQYTQKPCVLLVYCKTDICLIPQQQQQQQHQDALDV